MATKFPGQEIYASIEQTLFKWMNKFKNFKQESVGSFRVRNYLYFTTKTQNGISARIAFISFNPGTKLKSNIIYRVFGK